jgi:hypothetical protein
MMPEGPSPFHARLAAADLEACVRLLPRPRTILSPLPVAQSAGVAGVDAATWARLKAAGIAADGPAPGLAAPWKLAFARLAGARSRCRLALGTPESVDVTTFYAAQPWEDDALVNHLPGDGWCGIGFPASPRDVVTLALGHLGNTVLPEPAGVRERFPAAEFTVLLAAASLAGGGRAGAWFTAGMLLDACGRAPLVPAPPVRWASVAPWALEADEAVLSSGLASLRGRGLVHSLDGTRYAVAPGLAGFVAALRTMERYVAVDFAAETRPGAVRGVRFVAFVGRHAWWLLDYGSTAGDGAAAWAASIVPPQIDLAFERLAKLTRGERKGGMVDGEHSAGGQTAREVELTAAEVDVLVQAAGCVPVQASPLSGTLARPAPSDPQVVGRLAERGLLEGGHPAPGLAAALSALARPDFEIVEVGGALPVLACSRSYASAGGDSSFVVGYNCAGPDRHFLRYPLRAGDVFPVTYALLRAGRGGGLSSFTAVVDAEEFAALVALVDVYRAAALEAALNREQGPLVAVTPASVADAFRRGMEGTDRRWAVTLVRELSPTAPRLAPLRVPPVLAALSRRGYLQLVTRPGGSDRDAVYQLAPECAAFCRALAVVEAAVGVALVVGRGTVPGGGIGFMAFWAAGMVWMIDRAAEGAEDGRLAVQTVLPAELDLGLEAAYEYACDRARGVALTGDTARMSVPARVPTPPRVPAPAAAGRALPQRRCRACDAPVTPSARFCPACGAAAEAAVAETRCPGCGAPVPATGAAFCSTCGAALRAPHRGTAAAASDVPGATMRVATPPPVPARPAAPRCSLCGASLKPGLRFCTSCGARL